MPQSYAPRKADIAPASLEAEGRAAPAESRIFAALDLGTNNCRMLIAESLPNGRMRILDSYSSVVRLGEKVQQTGMLQEAAMERTLKALKECSEKLAYHKLTEAWFVATQACRVARNAKAFVNRAKRETGIELTVISERDEALLAFLGCSPLLDQEADYAVLLDIGGGSTELMLVDIQSGPRPSVRHWQSFPFGVMSLFEALGDTPMDTSSFLLLTREIEKEIQPFLQSEAMREVEELSRMQLLCTSGTATILGALALKLPHYDRSKVDGMELAVPTILNLMEEVLEMPPAMRMRHPCIGADRAPFVLPGAAIMHAVCQQLMVPSITVADRGVREGILFSLLQKYGKDDAEK